MTVRVLLVATPLLGHIGPLLTIGRALASAGYEVEVLSGERVRGPVERAGLTFLPLPSAAVADTLSDRPAAGSRLTPRWSVARRDVITGFIAPLRAQADALQSVIDGRGRYGVVLADTAFLGTLPLLLARQNGERPPLIGISVTPLCYLSSDAAPFGSGIRHRDGRLARQRNRRINWLLHQGPLRPIHHALDQALEPWRVPGQPVNYFDVVGMFDVTFQLGLPELEYPRSRLPTSVRCIGPVPVFSTQKAPSWFDELGGIAAGRPIIHITQGTVDNHDLSRLVIPAVQGLAERGLLLVVGTGGSSLDIDHGVEVHGIRQRTGRRHRTGHRGSTVLSTGFVPYDLLLPRIDLMITNGGWGGIQQAARHGVPLLVAGSTQEKPEAAARVAWAGLGTDLHSGRPSPARLRRATDELLGDDAVRARAQQLSLSAATRPDPVGEVLRTVEALIGAGRSAQPVESRTG